MGFLVMLVMLVAVVVATSAQMKYCAICPDHTLCIYQGKGEQCGTYKSGGVSDTDIAAILDLYNGYRSRVAKGQETRGAGPYNVGGPQPAAANMKKLVWDSELAVIAQRWADQCQNTNDACHQVSRFDVGQTLARVASSNATASWNTTVQNWYSDVQKFQKQMVDAYNYRTMFNTYAKMVWGNTGAIGCGYSYYKPDDSATNYQYYVCNYGPSGNYSEQPVYLRGPACSRCPAGTACAGGSLCVREVVNQTRMVM